MAYTLGWQMPSKELLLKFFAPGLAQDISERKNSPTLFTFERVVVERADAFRSNAAFPTDLSHFFAELDSVLSSKMKATLRENFRRFDSIAGWEVAEEFLCSCTFEFWLRFFAHIIMMEEEKNKAPSSGTTSSRTSKGFSTSPTMSSRTTDPSTSLDKTFDGASEGKIIQVVLEGPTIRQAWRTNTTVVGNYGATLQKLEEWAPDSNYVPMSPGGYAVYHGTAAHLKMTQWPDSWNDQKMNLAGQFHLDQMSPYGVGAVYTAFSPLRAFLWAAFQEHMYANTPKPKDIAWMQTTWTSAEKTFHGVAVFVFNVSQPKPSSPPMSVAMIPEGKGQMWHDRILAMSQDQATSFGLDTAWQYMSSLHGSTDINSWPEVLHGKEFGPQRAALMPFRTNMWRTCWSGKGIAALNSSYENTIAITFKKTATPPRQLKSTEPAQSQPPKKDDKDDGEGKGKGKGKDSFKTLTKKMSGLCSGKGKRRAGM